MRLQIVNLAKSFGDRTLFSELNHSFVEDGITVIRGESGSGKSTLLNILGLFEPADQGHVKYDGNIVSGLSDRATRSQIRQNVGYIYQDIRLFENLTALENVLLALRYSAVPRGEWNSIALSVFDRLGLMAVREQQANSLSGGEKQRVAIARVLATKKKIVLADEPTGALDEDNTLTVIESLKQMAAQGGRTIVLVTHSSVVAEAFPDRLRLHDGVLTRD